MAQASTVNCRKQAQLEFYFNLKKKEKILKMWGPIKKVGVHL